MPDRLHDDEALLLRLPMPMPQRPSVPLAGEAPLAGCATEQGRRSRDGFLGRRSRDGFISRRSREGRRWSRDAPVGPDVRRRASSPRPVRHHGAMLRRGLSTPKVVSFMPYIGEDGGESVTSALTEEEEGIRPRAISDAGLGRRASFAIGRDKVFGVFDRVFRRKGRRGRGRVPV